MRRRSRVPPAPNVFASSPASATSEPCIPALSVKMPIQADMFRGFSLFSRRVDRGRIVRFSGAGPDFSGLQHQHEPLRRMNVQDRRRHTAIERDPMDPRRNTCAMRNSEGPLAGPAVRAESRHETFGIADVQATSQVAMMF